MDAERGDSYVRVSIQLPHNSVGTSKLQGGKACVQGHSQQCSAGLELRIHY